MNAKDAHQDNTGFAYRESQRDITVTRSIAETFGRRGTDRHVSIIRCLYSYPA